MIFPFKFRQKIDKSKIKNLKKEIEIYDDYSEKKIKYLESEIDNLKDANEKFREEIFQLRARLKEYEVSEN